MAVPTSSYCRALPAYLQNLWALVKSSGDSWTPPADRKGEKRQPLAAPLLANAGSEFLRSRKILEQRVEEKTFAHLSITSGSDPELKHFLEEVEDSSLPAS